MIRSAVVATVYLQAKSTAAQIVRRRTLLQNEISLSDTWSKFGLAGNCAIVQAVLGPSADETGLIVRHDVA